MDIPNPSSRPTDRSARPPEPDGAHWYTAFLNPVVTIAVSILVSIFVLIGSAILGLDRGVLANMAGVGYARGLITYLFAVVTIGTAVVLVVSALTSADTEIHERRFQRGKEILALLLGVFGTIVGFYFGSEVTHETGLTSEVLAVTPIHFDSQLVAPGAQLRIDAHVSGGRSPYRFGVGYNSDSVRIDGSVDPDGWLEKTIAVPITSPEATLQVHLIVTDSEGKRTEESAPVVIRRTQ